MKRQIEIDDTLSEILEATEADVKQVLFEYLDAHDGLPNLGDLDYGGAIHEIIDSAVPIYTSEQNDLWYLYGCDFERAFDDAGIGEKDDDSWPMGWKPAAIYCYIEQHVADWYDENLDDLMSEWREK